ncbi:hypothetical protein GMRT_11042 [Giardia muris]|uniref:Uncharacterized protein n=1 Tax=Giardia muris TaxID=5742 RepID=A0A4Z1SNG5_GIAMU|nr:hypothetical protein GMRT_11042 [Giardia muris]|eukprot:TNJ27170.1 hypothetical protein GMRT_11042 [Giardia muris]
MSPAESVDGTLFEGFSPNVNRFLFRAVTVGLTHSLHKRRAYASFDEETHTAQLETADPEVVRAVRELFGVTSRTVKVDLASKLQIRNEQIIGKNRLAFEEASSLFDEHGRVLVNVTSSVGDARELDTLLSFIRRVFAVLVLDDEVQKVKLVVSQRHTKGVAEAILQNDFPCPGAKPNVEIIGVRYGQSTGANRAKVRVVLARKACEVLLQAIERFPVPPQLSFGLLRPSNEDLQ